MFLRPYCGSASTCKFRLVWPMLSGFVDCGYKKRSLTAVPGSIPLDYIYIFFMPDTVLIKSFISHAISRQ